MDGLAEEEEFEAGDVTSDGLPAFGFPDELNDTIEAVVVELHGQADREVLREGLAVAIGRDESSTRLACDFLQQFGIVRPRAEAVRSTSEDGLSIRWWVGLTDSARNAFVGAGSAL
ncbi:hypothetical protein [Actinosynnema sp. NPDC020468]|uniref:hypothetical protein n=1 Tax=Actinosynnema sp. NPDC020468 TaxID=3154488 RepID=UPI0033F48814